MTTNPKRGGIVALALCLIAGAITLFSNLSIGPPLWYSGLNTLPFVLLGVAAGNSKTRTCEITGSAIGGLLPVLGFHAIYLYDLYVRLPSEGGGANIGLGILYLSMPFWIVGGALVGWAIGVGIKGWHQTRKSP